MARLVCAEAKGCVLVSGHQRRHYTPHGYQAPRSNGRPGFNGQWQEPGQGLYGLGHGRRFYSPTLHRFLQPDPISPFGQGGLNAMAYCGGEPVNRIDPSGHNWLMYAIIGAAALEVGAGLSALYYGHKATSIDVGGLREQGYVIGAEKWNRFGKGFFLNAALTAFPLLYGAVAPALEGTAFAESPTVLGLSLVATAALGGQAFHYRRKWARPVGIEPARSRHLPTRAL